ncbi:FtsX-like permease family protein [Oricola cellulosilytica]|uniref:FtsX-like permease family protein n=1 Tax=Oricola cellulosilytica TaxID=1429082 RepID=A0A4R0PBP2_9HYPH|nr:FtsX-like permease family protein [Oricola cellulosilytica]TCD14870.1 FtsX-like permease family protein [Oricola cellulosilytica]
MTNALARVLGRLPIGWLQLVHSKTRLAAAVAGVAFANVLVFVQLGIFGALSETILVTYELFDADILISANDANTFLEGSNVARQRTYQALTVPGIAAALPVYTALTEWTQDDGNTSSLQVIGIDPGAARFLRQDLRERIPELAILNTALLDVNTRGVDAELMDTVKSGRSIDFELNGRTITIRGAVSFGGGFTADGYLFVSDQTFLRIFQKRISGAPDHILLKATAGAGVAAIVDQLNLIFPRDNLRVRTLERAAQEDLAYQTTERPIGLIFGFGVVIGVIVGIVIVYQVLSTDVADHMREYATFKAIGYRQRFFLGIVLEEAVILALFGFAPGISISWFIYGVLGQKSGLPLEMSVATATMVLIGTILACTFSGGIATRRLASADPADLF